MCVNAEHMRDCKPHNPSFVDSLNEAKGKSKHYVAFSLKTLYANPKNHPDRCYDANANSFFVQYSCV